ncbi:MAG TPA: amino acid permease [Gemmatimonadales bacterium]|nr:amino acid permease [Gemmatimonadales bacterium]
MGYAQELARRLGGFSNFAISFSIICILAGGITSFQLAFSAAGGAAVGIGWPLSVSCSLAVALAMGQIASAYPTAGGLYHWAAILGGRGWGWLTAWLNLAGLISVLSAIDVGFYLFVVRALGPTLGVDAGALTPWHQAAALAVIVGVQALVNHRGIHLTSRLTDLSGYLILGVAVALTLGLLVGAPSLDPARLVTFSDFGGAAGGNVWPEGKGMLHLFLLGLLLPAYTITGFDASAHTAEETLDAERNVPRGMVGAVLWSGLFGYAMVAAFVLAMPDPAAGAAQGDRVVFWTMEQVLPAWFRIACYTGIAVAQFLCGLATVTSASRMVYAFARDGGLPWSGVLRRVSVSHRTPAAAIWVVAVLAVALTLHSPVYATLTAVSVIFLYVSYGLPVALGLAAQGRTWTRMGPWRLEGWYRPVSLLALVACAGAIGISVMPPNGLALRFTLAALAVTAVVWFGYEVRRFEGPPVGQEIARRRSAISAAEARVGEGSTE